MNTVRFSMSLQQVEDSRVFAMDVDTDLGPDETLVPDARTGVIPSEMVDRKLLAALGGVDASGCRRGRYGYGGSGQNGGGRYGA
jgi:hypothetical protein